MIHLISVVGSGAEALYLEQKCIPDFKALMRTLTSGRVLIVSTKFRSDLFYVSEMPTNEAILKLWVFYAKTNLLDLDRSCIITSAGDEKSLSTYFESINLLSENWYQYKLYKKVFLQTFMNDHQNLVAKTIVQCDQYLVEHPNIKRTALINSNEKIESRISKDTLSLAMCIVNNQALWN